MNRIIVVGCGKLGSKLARTLSEAGHDVMVLERDARQLARLPEDYQGRETLAVSLDEDSLIRAGVRNSGCLIAATDNDSLNAMIAQLAQTVFKVPTVLCRISDPQREAFYKGIGLNVLCPTNLCAAAIIERVGSLNPIRMNGGASGAVSG